MPSPWLMFDRIRALAKQHKIYQADRIYQDQSSLDRAAAGGDFSDNSVQAAILDQTNLQINRLERYKDYEQMDQTGEINLALDLYCLAKNTKIPLLDGTCPTIAELSKSGNNEFWLYGYDFVNDCPKPVLGRLPHVSGRQAQLVRVQWDGGYIDCTPSHKFHTKRGWIEAGNLLSGDSITPINIIRHCIPPSGADRRVAQGIRKGYEAIQNGSDWQLTHRWVFNHFNQPLPKGDVIHHKDIRRKNNRPDNLEHMTWLAHRKLHEKLGKLPPEIEEQRRKSVSKAIKAKWRDPEYRRKLRPHCVERGYQLLNSGKAFRGGSKPTTDWEGVCLIAKTLGARITHSRLAKQAKISRATLDRMLKRANTDWPTFKALNIDDGGDKTIGSVKERIIRYAADMVEIGLNPRDWESNRDKLGCAKRNVPTLVKVEEHFESLDSLAQLAGYNHTVQSVTILSETADKVYDLYVDDGHAFAAGTDTSWVLVHNSDEASLVDPERKHTIVIRARNRRLKQELEDFFFGTLLWDTYCRPSIRYLCKYGDLPFEIVPTEHRDGVASLRFMNVYNFTRIETRFGDLVGFFYQDDLFPQPQFLHPWQVMHLRLTSFENIYHPYGRAVLDGGRKAFKQLRLMEDAALIYRITRAPEKRKFFIPVGLIPPKEVPEYMQMIARMFKRQRFYNPTTGTFDERYSPLIQEDDFLLPRRPDGSGPDIDVLPGAENLDQIADIEYFKKKMIAPTKIPFERVGIGEGSGGSSEKSLSQTHSEFAKAVQWVQREVATGLKKVAIVHLALRGFSVEDLKGFDIALTATSAMEELYRIETWQTRVGVMAELKDLGWFPKEWIVTHFTDLSPDEIEELKDMEGEDAQGGPGGGMPGGLDIPDEEGEGLPPDMPETAMAQDPSDPDAGGIPLDLGVEDDEAAAESFNGLDIKAQRRVLQELVKQGKRDKARSIMEIWAKRLGRSTISEEVTHVSGFNHLLTMKELDGLTGSSEEDGEKVILTEDNQKKYTIVEGLEIIDPNSNEGLLVEWSVEKELRDETIKEVFDVITLGEESSGDNESEEITEDDLPETNVSEL